MDKMRSDHKLWCVFWFCACTTIIGVAWAIAYGSTAVDLEAIKKGMVQVEYVSHSNVNKKWVKQTRGEN